MHENKEMMEFLKSIGAIEEVEGGFRLTESAANTVPEMVKKHESNFNNDVFSLWMSDMIDLNFDEDGEPMIDLSDISRDEEMQLLLLTNQEKLTLEMIILQYDKRFDKKK